MNDDVDLEDLEGRLSEQFGHPVHVDIRSESSQPTASLVVCDITYHETTEESHRRICQTAVVLDANGLNLPQFALAPHRKGLLSKVASALLGGMDLNFEDSPEFSETYQLYGWVEDAVRALFNKDLRDYFADHKTWSVRGLGSQLVIFRHNKTRDENQIDAFTQQSLEILALFRDAEAKLDEHPEIRRETKPDDLRATMQNMGGIAGAMLQAQLKKIAVTQVELDAFVAEPVPRNPPKGLQRQVVGDTFILIPVGILFFAVGLIIGGLTVLTSDDKTGFEVGMLFLFTFPLVGGLMAGITYWHRRKKLRVLRQGIVTVGTPTKMEKSSIMVNDQLRHVVTVEFEAEGQTRTTICNVYGGMASTARKVVDDGEPVTLLVDPADSSHVVCTDFLTIFEG